ncbi:MAG: hypothetical protein ACRDT2_14540, partial [Natronosporangium sp.]
DVAAQHYQLGYHSDALEIIRLAEGDERVAPGVRMVLHGVKARAYAAVGEVAACRQHVGLAETAYDLARTGERAAPGWVDRLAQPAQLAAITGHALATVAHRTGDPADLDDAVGRLAAATDAFDPVSHARPRSLCQARLAGLHLAAGDLDQAVQRTREALDAVAGIRSARIIHAITQLRSTIADHPDQTELQNLVDEIDAGIGAPDEGPGPGEEAEE